MEGMLTANRHGHVVCTQGGESIAGLKKAVKQGLVGEGDTFVVDSTSHQLKFSEFQRMYFEGSFPKEYGVETRDELKNLPVSLGGNAKEVAEFLKLKKR
jgi:threonine synthase